MLGAHEKRPVRGVFACFLAEWTDTFNKINSE